MANTGADDVAIRVATPDDHVAVARVLDGALLDVADLEDRIAAGTVLLASVDRGGGSVVVGAAVLAPEGPDVAAADGAVPTAWLDATHVRSVAVRRNRRRRGIGSALLEAARDRWGPLVADFDVDVAAFYDALGAERRPAGADRQWALLPDE